LFTVFYAGDFPRLKRHVTDLTSSIFSAAFLAASICKEFLQKLAQIHFLSHGVDKLLKTKGKMGGWILAIWN